MVSEYLRPGVHTERVDATRPGVSVVRTDIAGVVGIAQSGPLDTPVPVESFRQFQAHFGDFTGQGFLAYSVRAFFENGGRRCWVVRVASREPGVGAQAAEAVLEDAHQPVWTVEASSEGVWGNLISVSFQEQRSGQAVVAAHALRANFAPLSSIAGFERGSLIQLSQGNGASVWRVISDVDVPAKRIYWVHPEPGLSLPYDAPIDMAAAGFDRSQSVTVETLTYRVLVRREGRLIEQYSDISLVREHARYGPTVLASPSYPVRLEAQQRIPSPPPSIVLRDGGDATGVPEPFAISTGERIALSGGRDGLESLALNDFVGEPVSPLDSDTVTATKRRGIEALDQIDEIGIAAVPDICIRPLPDPVFTTAPAPEVDPCVLCPPPPEEPRQQPFVPPSRTQELPPAFSDDQIFQVQSALIQQCEQRGDRMAVLDPPYSAAQDDRLGVSAIVAWRARFESSYAALYYPWLKVTEPRGTRDVVRDVPPSGHMLGQFAVHDFEVGVHRAPANRSMTWAVDVTVQASDGYHEMLNPLGINVIRGQVSRGVRALGARTTSSDPDWRYINVRRLVLMIRKALDISTQWAAFEPNDATTRNKIILSTTSFLTALWRRGALTGGTAEEAFFVKCDEENNPADQRAEGMLVAQIGVAPSQPFEFIVLRVGRQGNEVEIAEVGFLGRVA